MIPNIPLDPPDTPNPPLPPADDPGGARSKGYSADPDSDVPEIPEVPDPIPLVDAMKGGIHVPERDPGVQPTGRSNHGSNDPKERLLGEGG